MSARLASERYIWSVTPCLMAWPAVAMQAGPGSLVLATVLGVVYAVDRYRILFALGDLLVEIPDSHYSSAHVSCIEASAAQAVLMTATDSILALKGTWH